MKRLGMMTAAGTDCRGGGEASTRARRAGRRRSESRARAGGRGGGRYDACSSTITTALRGVRDRALWAPNALATLAPRVGEQRHGQSVLGGPVAVGIDALAPRSPRPSPPARRSASASSRYEQNWRVHTWRVVARDRTGPRPARRGAPKGGSSRSVPSRLEVRCAGSPTLGAWPWRQDVRRDGTATQRARTAWRPRPRTPPPPGARGRRSPPAGGTARTRPRRPSHASADCRARACASSAWLSVAADR